MLNIAIYRDNRLHDGVTTIKMPRWQTDAVTCSCRRTSRGEPELIVTLQRLLYQFYSEMAFRSTQISCRHNYLLPRVSHVNEAHVVPRFGWILSIFSTNATSFTSFWKSLLMNINEPWKRANRLRDFNLGLKYIRRIPKFKWQHLHFICHLRPGLAGLARNWVGNSSCARTAWPLTALRPCHWQVPGCRPSGNAK